MRVHYVRTVVHSDDVKAIEELSFVLMNSFHLNVKHRGRVYLHFVLSLQVLCKLPLVVLITHTKMINNHNVNNNALTSLLLFNFFLQVVHAAHGV